MSTESSLAPFSRRNWLKSLALASLANPKLLASPAAHFAPRAKRIIWLTQAGAPSQLDLFDYKPGLASQFDKDLPNSVRGEQRLTGMTSGQKRFPIAPSVFKFAQHGQSGMWLSELLPHTSKFADEICLVRSLHTEAINHDPAMTLLQTGHQIGGRPAFGAWVSYGLGSDNADLPAFVALISRPSGPTNAQPLHERMWGSGFLPSKYQGVLTRDNHGRDHHPRCYSVWMAGAGVKGGHVHGETDDFSYNIVKDPVHIHDLNATALHLLGLDHSRLTYRFQGRDYRLTDIHGEIVKSVLA